MLHALHSILILLVGGDAMYSIEDVRSIFLTTFINVAKSNGGRNAA
jgi:hypothetical protein